MQGALKDVPLVDVARDRSVIWLHVSYGLIILAFLVVLVLVLWVLANLRERARMYLMQEATLVRSREVIDVPKTMVEQ